MGMRITAFAMLLALTAPVHADALRAGPNSLTGVLKWVPSKMQEGGQDLALVAGDQTIRFWAGGKLDGAELEKNVDKPVKIDGTVHEHTGAWFIAPDTLVAAAASDVTSASAPKAPITAPPQRASDLASQWFLDQNRGKRMEPVVRVKKIEGNLADVLVTGQSEDGSFGENVRLAVDLEKGEVSRRD